MRFLNTSFLILLLVSVKLISQEDYNLKLIQSVTEKDYKSSYVVIYDSTDVDVMESGLSYVTMHKLIKVLNQRGANLLKLMSFDYDPLSAYVQIKLAKIYRKNGDIEIIDNSRIYDYPAPARMIYWGGRKLTVEFGALEAGDAIEIITFRKGFTYALLYNDEDEKFIPPMKGHFYDIINFWSSVPVIEKVYRIAMPENKPLQYEVYNGELSSYIHFPKKINKNIKVLVNPNDLSDKGSFASVNSHYQREDKVVYCWYKKDIKPFGSEANMVATSDVAPKLLVSTSPDWYAKAVWFNKVNEDFKSFEVTPEVKAKVDELLKGVSDEFEKISILNHWVAEEVRYSGISMGEGEGYTLHKGQMTFADRCGVCKDKAGMLVTMLRAAGFESYPAMTMAGSRIDYIPADQFNHSVTVVKLSNGNWMLLDPTWIPGVREMWSSAEQQQQFLMGIPGGSDLMTTPISPPEKHYLKIKGESELKANGDLEGKVIVIAEGQSDASIRRMFNRTYQSQWKEIIPELFSEVSNDVEIRNINMNDPYDVKNPMKIEIEYIYKNYALITKDQMVFTPLLVKFPFYNYSFSFELFADTSLINLNYPFRLRFSKLIEIEETIKLPGNKKVILPDNYNFEGQTASFNSNFDLSKNKLLIKAKHILHKRIYETKEWAEVRNALVNRLKFMDSKVIIKK